MASKNSRNRPRVVTPAVEERILLHLRARWIWVNRHCQHRLREARIALTDAASPLCAWDRAGRALLVSRPLVEAHPWGAVLRAFTEQVIHQYVDEVLGLAGEPAHGEAFRLHLTRVLTREARKQFAYGAATGADTPEGRVLQRIQRLLALSESSNPHEAESAMQEAQRLMLKHNLSLQDQAGPQTATYVVRHLGPVRMRISEMEYRLGWLLQEHFFVKSRWVSAYDPWEDKDGFVLEVHGTPANVALADYVYGFLTDAALRLWEEYRSQGDDEEIRGERPSYLAGVIEGFDQKLTWQRRSHQQQGLIWKGDAGLEAHYQEIYPPRPPSGSTWSFQGSGGGRLSGVRAGHQIELRTPVGGGRSSGGGSLPGR
jgi:hypothetical protein